MNTPGTMCTLLKGLAWCVCLTLAGIAAVPVVLVFSLYEDVRNYLSSGGESG